MVTREEFHEGIYREKVRREAERMAKETDFRKLMNREIAIYNRQSKDRRLKRINRAYHYLKKTGRA